METEALALVMATVALIVLSSSVSLAMLLTSGFLLGLSLGSTAPVLTAFAIDRVKTEERGAAMGTFSTALELGAALGAILLGKYSSSATIERCSSSPGWFPFLELPPSAGSTGRRRRANELSR